MRNGYFRNDKKQSKKLAEIIRAQRELEINSEGTNYVPKHKKKITLSQYFDNYIHFKENLESLFGREVDLLEEQTLKNPILIKSINKSKKLIYG